MIDLDHNFKYHAPDVDKRKRHEALRDECKELAFFILNNCPNGRESTIAIRKVEEAMMWGNAAIARNE